MYYLFLAFPLLIYFELLGRLFFYYIRKEKLEFNFIIGFCILIAFLYVVGWPISVYGLASIYYVILVSLLVIISIILIVKNIKKLDLKFNKLLWAIFFICLIVSIIISFNRTLGDPHGFDALFYINFVGYNVDTPSLNNVHPLFGSIPNTYYEKTITYAFQSYNYFVSVFVYIMKRFGSLIHVNIETLPTYVWTFQIILSAFYIGSSIEVIKHINSKNKLFNIGAFILLVFFMGNFYYNNCFGFIGCNYRMPIHTIATIYLIDYLKNNDKKDLFLFMLLMLSMCGFSSTGTFAFVFILFALFFVLVNNEDHLLKYYAIVLFIPVLNILIIKINSSLATILVTFAIVTIVFLLNNPITKLFRNNYVKYATIFIIAITLICISLFFFTKNGNVLKYFFDNYSELQDMSWDYFMFTDVRHWIYNTIVLVPLFYYLIRYRKTKLAMAFIILIITVFNPLSANFMNTINWVYYRTYDLIINQYTILFFLYTLSNNLNLSKILPIGLLALSVVLSIIQIPRYYHYQFIPDDDYNPSYKIDNKELELIWNLQKLIENKKIDKPKIANPTFYLNSFIKNSQTLIGKEKIYNYSDNNADNFGLYLIEFPEDGWDNFKPDEASYDNLLEYLNGTDYNILVVDYEKYFKYHNEYLSFSEVMEKEGYIKSDYSTNNYAIFLLD